jgi:hypothetical protein
MRACDSDNIAAKVLDLVGAFQPIVVPVPMIQSFLQFPAVKAKQNYSE